MPNRNQYDQDTTTPNVFSFYYQWNHSTQDFPKFKNKTHNKKNTNTNESAYFADRAVFNDTVRTKEISGRRHRQRCFARWRRVGVLKLRLRRRRRLLRSGSSAQIRHGLRLWQRARPALSGAVALRTAERALRPAHGRTARGALRWMRTEAAVRRCATLRRGCGVVWS